MVWSPGAVSVEIRDVSQRHCFSIFTHCILFRPSAQELNTNLNNFLDEYQI